MLRPFRAGQWAVVLSNTGDRLVNVRELKTGGMILPSVLYNDGESRMGLFDGFETEFDCSYYWSNPRTGACHIFSVPSDMVRVLTDKEQKELDIYFSGSFDQYPLILNSKFLSEAARKRIKNNTFPNAVSSFL
jgi:hypothetical protein